MTRVKILSEEVANRIAAGEVIERPASVVKECVENSIDAGATEITVKIINGGRDFIQIIDNGIGMSEDDAFLAFERHGTSKIRTVDDILHIATLGFRGEALPSMASVSRLELITKTAEDALATELHFAGGKLEQMKKTSANNGTSITIQNLFFNVPARRKFLKSEPVEYKHIMNYLHYQAICFPDVSFILISNSKEKFNFPCTKSIEARMLDIFGTSFTQQSFLYFAQNAEIIKLSGYLQDVDTQPQSQAIDTHYIFVNKRYIYDKTIYAAIRAAYDPFIKKYHQFDGGKLPSYILFLDISPEEIDINVHPAKTEIRFKNIGAVYQFVKDAIFATLQNAEENRYKQTEMKIASVPMQSPLTTAEAIIAKEISDKRWQGTRPSATIPSLHSTPQPNRPSFESVKQLHQQGEDSLVLWQLHNTYIFVQTEDGFWLIDQHAAHERIMYEKLLKNIAEKKPNKQKLVFPIVIDLPAVFSEEIKQTIETNQQVLEDMGFTIKSFSGNSVVIDEIPAEIGVWDGGNIFIEVLKQLQDELAVTTDFRIASAASVACKASIKAGKRLTKREMFELINELFTCEFPFHCPHGRPLIFKMSLTDIEKVFKRIE